ncbi:MAG: hypothetical protein RL168_297, partial [Bacteroidota bacterium]
RAIQAQLGKGSPATVASAAPAAPATPVVPDSPLTSAAPSAPPASEGTPSAEHEEKPKAVAPVEQGSKTPAASTVPEVKTQEIAAVPASTADVPAENASDAPKVAVAPEVPESPLPSAAPSVPPSSELAPPPKERSPDPTLSPFANFLAGLKEGAPQTAVPAGQRDPAMERAILEQFLEINPKIKPVRDAPMGENLALRTPNVSGLVTETLANHYYDQGMTEKAIQAYEILKLKVPEKSVIFAARISEMRKTQSSTK